MAENLPCDHPQSAPLVEKNGPPEEFPPGETPPPPHPALTPPPSENVPQRTADGTKGPRSPNHPPLLVQGQTRATDERELPLLPTELVAHRTVVWVAGEQLFAPISARTPLVWPPHHLVRVDIALAAFLPEALPSLLSLRHPLPPPLPSVAAPASDCSRTLQSEEPASAVVAVVAVAIVVVVVIVVVFVIAVVVLVTVVIAAVVAAAAESAWPPGCSTAPESASAGPIAQP